MKKILVSLVLVFIFFGIVGPAGASESSVRLNGVEFLLDGKPFVPPRIEKIQILGALKKEGMDNVIINFYDPLHKNYEGTQVGVEIITLDGEKYKGLAETDSGRGKFFNGLANAVNNALSTVGASALKRLPDKGFD